MTESEEWRSYRRLPNLGAIPLNVPKMITGHDAYKEDANRQFLSFGCFKGFIVIGDDQLLILIGRLEMKKGIEKIKIDALKRKIRRNQCLFFRFSELIFCKRAVVERWCSN